MRRWTRQETDTLTAHYPNKTLKELMLLLPSRSKSAIINQIFFLNLRKRDFWTAEEDNTMKLFYPTCKRKEILLLFPGRSWSSIYKRAALLNIHRSRQPEKSALERFTLLTNKISDIFGENDVYPTECWQWIGGKHQNGYGVFYVKNKQILAHRWSYEHFKEPIPENLVIDHLCRNRACVNPEHMEIVTTRENAIRGIGPSAINAKRTKCTHGHEFTKENTYVNPSGTRECRTCKLNRQRIKRGKNKC